MAAGYPFAGEESPTGSSGDRVEDIGQDEEEDYDLYEVTEAEATTNPDGAVAPLDQDDDDEEEEVGSRTGEKPLSQDDNGTDYDEAGNALMDLDKNKDEDEGINTQSPLVIYSSPCKYFLLTVSLKFTALAGFAGSEGSDSDVPVLAIVGGGLILATIIGIAGFILYKKAGASNATAAAAASGKGAAAGTAAATTKAAAAGAAGGLEVAAANAGGASASSVAQTGSTASYKSAIGAASKAGSKSAAGAATNSGYHGGRAIPFKHRAPVKSFAKTALTSLAETTDKSVYKVIIFTVILKPSFDIPYSL